MSKCLFVFIAFAAIAALVIFIKYLRNLHTRISRLESKAAPHLEIIEREIHGIGFYMRIIVGIAIFFCVGICVHYLCYCHPRLISSNAPDYMGTLVGISTILVTLLVGWQIFSSIKTRDELHNTRDEIERRFAARLEALDDCCKKGQTKLAELDKDQNFLGESIIETQNKLLDARAQIIRFSSITWAAVLYNEPQSVRLTKLIFTTISGVALFLQIDEFMQANAMLNTLLDNIVKLEDVKLTPIQKRMLLKEANNLDNIKLERLDELKLYLTE